MNQFFLKTYCVEFKDDLCQFSELPALVRSGDILHGHLAVRVGHLVDFSLDYDELNEKYCQDNGRTAEDPVRMFNYLTYLDWTHQFRLQP